MNCRDLEELLSAYADGELSHTQREFIEEHLAGCANCCKTLADYIAAGWQLSSLRTIPTAPDMREATLSKIREGSVMKSRQRWLRPALVLATAAIILALVIIQPWSTLPGPQNVIAKAYSAAENLQSYRMWCGSTKTTSHGEVSELTFEAEFMAPDRYHVKLVEDEEITEFILTGNRQYVKSGSMGRNAALAFTRSSSSFLSKEVTMKMLDALTDLQELPDENMDGVVCFHYRGRVDMEKQMEEIKANLDPSDPNYARLLEEMEQMRNMKHMVELWVGKDDYLIRQTKQIYQLPTEEGQWNSFGLAMKYYDLNKPVTIEPPVDASGKLLLGWQLISSYPGGRVALLASSATSTIGGEDPAHQQISYRITITNHGEEVAGDVRVKILVRATNDESRAVMMEAEPVRPGQVDLGPDESETYNVSWEYDASNTPKEELARLIDYTRVFTRCTTPGGIEDVQAFSTGVVYPIKSPPTRELVAQYEQARQQADFPINVPTNLPRNLELSHVQVQGMPDGSQMLILLYGDPDSQHIRFSQRRFDIEMVENGEERQKSFEEAGFSRFTIMNISGYWKQGVLCQTDIDDPSTQYWDISKIQMFWDEGDMTYQLTTRGVPIEELMVFAASMVTVD